MIRDLDAQINQSHFHGPKKLPERERVREVENDLLVCTSRGQRGPFFTSMIIPGNVHIVRNLLFGSVWYHKDLLEPGGGLTVF